jgi:hypothetical protein
VGIPILSTDTMIGIITLVVAITQLLAQITLQIWSQSRSHVDLLAMVGLHRSQAYANATQVCSNAAAL